MSTSTPLRRSLYGLGAATVLTLTLTGPASARPLPEPMPTTAGAAQPAAQPHNPGPPSYNSTWQGWSPPSSAVVPVDAAGVSADSLQYLQIGLGALSGAVVSIGALTLAARTRRGRLTHA